MLSVVMFSSWLILFVALIIGFAHLIWLFSAKESGSTKLIGQIIAWVIVIVTVLLVVIGGYHGKRMMKKDGLMMCPLGGMMMGPKMMMDKGMTMDKAIVKDKGMKKMHKEMMK